MTRRARTIWSVIAGVVMAGEVVLSSIPGDVLVDTGFELDDKLAHAVMYGAIAGALRFALSGTRRPWIYAIAIAIGFGITDELHQIFVRGRDCSILDLVADALGAMLGAAVATRIVVYRSRRDAGS